MQPVEVVNFWRDAGPDRWFGKDDSFDDMVEIGFELACDQAAAGTLDDWAESPEGALALVILLDQMPRNIHRDTAAAYAADSHARSIAAKAIDNGFDQQVEPAMQRFFYTPFMHSENIEDQNRCVELFRASDIADGEKWAEHHRRIIQRFGRFPHRNAILGRESTEEEKAWLENGGYKG